MTENIKPSLCIICPSYNEMETITPSINSLLKILEDLGNKSLINFQDSRVLIVDDGSTDNSWSILQKLSEAYENLQCIKLSRNFGHQNALLAGLMNSN
ncbi:MAG: glycosyltransferase, partial [Gammaproteobacteria bacterium]